jgi:hypothetical protein
MLAPGRRNAQLTWAFLPRATLQITWNHFHLRWLQSSPHYSIALMKPGSAVAKGNQQLSPVPGQPKTETAEHAIPPSVPEVPRSWKD